MYMHNGAGIEIHIKKYDTFTGFSLYKNKSILFASSLKITVKRLSPCSNRLSPCQKGTKTPLSEHIAISFKLTKRSETFKFRMHPKCITS